MGIFDKITSKFGKKNAPPTPAAPQDDLIKVYDGYGREMYVTREVWRKQVLPNQLRADAGDPDKLYTLIVSALQDGFHAEVSEASEQLLRADRGSERSHAVRSIVLMKNGNTDGAESVLQSYVRSHGPTGTILTNLAKVYSQRGEDEKAERTLREAIELDPNQENGLQWFAAMRNEKGGRDEYLRALKEAADVAGSWRPQLWLARECLDEGRIEEARDYYRHVLSHAAGEPGVLMMISGDLGKRGRLSDIFDLITPVYSPERHDAAAGINLLQAYLEAKNYADGEGLLHKLFELNRPDLKRHLMFYSEQFEKLKEAARAATPPVSAPVEVSAFSFTNPIWAYGLESAEWLFADDNETGRRIGFLVLANTTPSGLDEPRQQKEDDAGRLTRSIPLFLAERLLFTTDARSVAVVPFVQGAGPVVSGAPWPAGQVLQFAGENTEVMITGALQFVEGRYDVSLDVWDVKAKRLARTFAAHAPGRTVGETLLKLSEELSLHLGREYGVEGVTPQPYYLTPGGRNIDAYLSALGQSLSLTLAENGVTPRGSLWGERNILNWFLSLALEMEGAQVPKIIFLSGLVKNRAYGSEIYKEFKAQLLKLIDEEKDARSPFYRLTPLAFRTFDMDAEFDERKRELSAAGDERYNAWLERL